VVLSATCNKAQIFRFTAVGYFSGIFSPKRSRWPPIFFAFLAKVHCILLSFCVASLKQSVHGNFWARTSSKLHSSQILDKTDSVTLACSLKNVFSYSLRSLERFLLLLWFIAILYLFHFRSISVLYLFYTYSVCVLVPVLYLFRSCSQTCFLVGFFWLVLYFMWECLIHVCIQLFSLCTSCQIIILSPPSYTFLTWCTLLAESMVDGTLRADRYSDFSGKLEGTSACRVIG